MKKNGPKNVTAEFLVSTEDQASRNVKYDIWNILECIINATANLHDK